MTSYDAHPEHPLCGVPQEILDVARAVMQQAVTTNDVDAEMADPIADSVVAELAQHNMLTWSNNKLFDGERLMAYYEVGRIINEANADALAVVRGIHEENTMVVNTKTHVMEFAVLRVDDIKAANETIVCNKCKTFAVPAPLDHVGEALMTAHLATCK